MAKKIEVILAGDTSSLERAFRRAGTEAGGFGNAIGKAAKTAAVAGVALGGLAVVGIKKSLDAYSDLNEQINKNKVVFRSNGDEVVKWSQGLAQNFGLSSRAALESAGTFGNMLVPMGFARDKAADMSKGLVELAGDMSSFNNASPADTLEAIRSGLAGETEPLRKYGVFLNQARIQTELLTEGVKGNWNEISQASKAQAIYNIIQKDTIDAHGDFARTSTGMANAQRVFSAELENASAQLGQMFYPAAVKVLGIVNATIPRIEAMLPAIKEGIGNAWDRYGQPAFAAMLAGGKLIVEWTRENWPQISAHISSAMSTIRSIIAGVTAVVQAIWSRFGDAITEVATRSLGAAVTIIRDAFNIIDGMFKLVGDLIHGRWGKVWDDIKQIVSNTFDAIMTIIGTAVSNAYTMALAVGKALVGGIVDGITGLASSVKDKVSSGIRSGIDGVKGVFHIGSPSGVTRDEVGIPLAQGVILGWIDGTRDLPTKISDSLRKAIDRGKATVDSARTAFSTAWSNLASDSLRAFDANSQAVIDKLRARFDAMRNQIDTQLSATLSGLDREQRQLTPAEAALQKLQSGHAEAGRQQAISDARQQLADATASGDSQAILSAQRALNDALYTEQEAALTRKAEEQRQARDREIEAQRVHAQKVADDEKKALDDRQKTEETELQALADLRSRHFAEALDQLAAYFKEHGATVSTSTTDIIKLLKSFHINFGSAGAELGAAFVRGLKESIASAAKGSGKVSSALSAAAAGIQIPSFGGGGIVPGPIGAPMLAVVHGGEVISPGGYGGGDVHVHFHGGTYIGGNPERIAADLAPSIERELRRRMNRGGLGIASI